MGNPIRPGNTRDKSLATLRAKVAALAVASCFAAGWAQANPTNPVVTHGAASFSQSGNLLQITNSPNTIINWGSFSIGASEITRFIQQNSASAVLNRVGAGGDPSVILGSLLSNGRVFLINPNGIAFGAGSQINVAGLVASTLNLSDADFLAGRMRFADGLGKSVINDGNITTGTGGNVYLVGHAVTNNGIITSPKGEVILAAGNSVELVNPGTPDLRVEISAPDNHAVNLGQIIANSGRVGIYAGLINHAGTINANSVAVDAAGNITLKASKNIDLAAGSTITANGPQGGTVTVQSGDTTLAAGAIEARGSAGQGGNVSVLGNLVGLTGNARIDVSGVTGGGTVLVGGDYQGKNPAIQNAFRTYVGPDTRIKADAITSGDGGKVIVWGDDVTRFFGNISARGGNLSGNGGFVEVSGKRYLDFQGSVNTLAPFGATGTLLLDPTDIQINSADGATPNTFLTGNVFQDTGAVNTSEILNTTLANQLGLSNVTIKTQNAAGVGPLGGTVTFNANVNKPDSGGATTLQVEAENNIIVSGNVTISAASSANPLHVNFIANSDSANGGSIQIGNGDQLTTIDTKGGNIFLGGPAGGFAVANSLETGILIDRATLDAGSGSITIRGQGACCGSGTSNHGVAISGTGGTGGSTLQTTSGNIIIDGIGGAGDNVAGRGILVDANGAGNVTKITSANGVITLTGTGGSNNTLGNGNGIELSSGAVIESTGVATISITGTAGGSTAPGDTGILVTGAGTKITSITGDIQLTGTGGSSVGGTSDNSNIGISIVGNAVVESTGTARLTFNGIGGNSDTNGNHGVLVTTGGIVRSQDGAIVMNGTGGGGAGGSDQGITLGTSALIQSNGAATINLNGTGGNATGGTGSNVGVSIFDGAKVDSTGSGAIVINGTGRGAGASNHGVQMQSTAATTTVASTGAAIDIFGTATTAGNGIDLSSPASFPLTISATGNGNITLNADSINLAGGAFPTIVNAAGSVFVRPTSTARDIFIEGGASAGLSLTPAELQLITAGTSLVIGRNTDTGTLSVNTGITSTEIVSPIFRLEHQNITVNSPINFAAGGEILQLSSGTGGGISGTGLISTNSALAISTNNASATLNVSVPSLGTIALGTGALNLTNTGALAVNGTVDATGGITLNTSGTLTINNSLNAGTGNVSLTTTGAGNAITQTAGQITGNTLTLSTNNASATLNTSNNAITNLGATALGTGALNLLDAGGLTVTGAVAATGGITLNTSGALALNNSLNAGTGNMVLTGSSITQSAGTMAAGGMTLTAPVITIGGTATATANFNLPSGTFNINSGGSFSVSGTTNIAVGATLATGGSFTALGPITVAGTLRGSAAGPINATGQVISVPGTLDLNGGSVTAGSVNVSGLLKGIGTITGNVTNSGTVAPGASPGIINITGNYTQAAAGTLQIEIGGTTPGTGYDQLQVSGTANLNGSMALTQFGTFVPAALNSFQPITAAGGVTGTFANVVIPAVFAGLGVSYLSTSVDVTAPQAAAALTIVAVDPRIVNEDKDIFEQVVEDQDIFRKRETLVCN